MVYLKQSGKKTEFIKWISNWHSLDKSYCCYEILLLHTFILYFIISAIALHYTAAINQTLLLSSLHGHLVGFLLITSLY